MGPHPVPASPPRLVILECRCPGQGHESGVFIGDTGVQVERVAGGGLGRGGILQQGGGDGAVTGPSTTLLPTGCSWTTCTGRVYISTIPMRHLSFLAFIWALPADGYPRGLGLGLSSDSKPSRSPPGWQWPRLPWTATAPQPGDRRRSLLWVRQGTMTRWSTQVGALGEWLGLSSHAGGMRMMWASKHGTTPVGGIHPEPVSQGKHVNGS